LLTGADPQLTFQKLTEAVRTVLRGVTWIATNLDRLFPGVDGLIPGAGAVVSAISYSTQKNPNVMIGKPSPYLFEIALKRLGLPPEGVLVVGDLIEADIVGGRNAGLATALVLTGVSGVDDIERTQVRPDYTLKSVSELVST
jgi:4-nitrophenyl phosphatase